MLEVGCVVSFLSVDPNAPHKYVDEIIPSRHYGVISVKEEVLLHDKKCTVYTIQSSDFEEPVRLTEEFITQVPKLKIGDMVEIDNKISTFWGFTFKNSGIGRLVLLNSMGEISKPKISPDHLNLTAMLKAVE